VNNRYPFRRVSGENALEGRKTAVSGGDHLVLEKEPWSGGPEVRGIPGLAAGGEEGSLK